MVKKTLFIAVPLAIAALTPGWAAGAGLTNGVPPILPPIPYSGTNPAQVQQDSLWVGTTVDNTISLAAEQLTAQMKQQTQAFSNLLTGQDQQLIAAQKQVETARIINQNQAKFGSAQSLCDQQSGGAMNAAGAMANAFSKGGQLSRAMNTGSPTGPGSPATGAGALPGSYDYNLGRRYLTTGQAEKAITDAAPNRSEFQAPEALFDPTQSGQASVDNSAKYIAHLTNDRPDPQLSSSQQNTPQGKHYQAMQLTMTARMSLATYALQEVATFNLPSVPLSSINLPATQSSAATAFSDMLKNRAALTGGYISPRSFLESYAHGFFLNQDWYAQVASQSGDDLTRQMLFMQAAQMQIQYQTMVALQNLESIAAAQYAQQVKDKYEQPLEAARAAAVSGQGGQ